MRSLKTNKEATVNALRNLQEKVVSQRGIVHLIFILTIIAEVASLALAISTKTYRYILRLDLVLLIATSGAYTLYVTTRTRSVQLFAKHIFLMSITLGIVEVSRSLENYSPTSLVPAILALVLLGVRSTLFYAVATYWGIIHLTTQDQYYTDWAAVIVHVFIITTIMLAQLRVRLAFSERDAAMQQSADLLDTQRAVYEILTQIVHDLRSPLSAIKGYISLIEQSYSPADIQEVESDRAALNRSMEFAERMLTQFLEIARLNARKHTLALTGVNVHQLVMSVTAAQALHSSVRLEYDVPEGLVVTTDYDLLHRILGNIVSNASKYARSHVLISAATSSTHVVISVHDDGGGISTEDLRKLSMRNAFTRVGDRRQGGFGLGLNFARSAAEALGGEMRITSSVGEGTQVTILLPP
jgi:signal transduction histidine kinase